MDQTPSSCSWQGPWTFEGPGGRGRVIFEILEIMSRPEPGVIIIVVNTLAGLALGWTIIVDGHFY
jgi:hypothetical protein